LGIETGAVSNYNYNSFETKNKYGTIYLAPENAFYPVLYYIDYNIIIII